MALKNQINTYADVTAYNDDQNKEYPNVSYIVATDEVKWVGEDPTLIIAKYNVTSTSSATTLLGATTNISKMWIDGVEQQSVVTTYTFSTTGEHELKYKYEGNETAYGLFISVENLTSVKIPYAITRIGERTFRFCTGLTSVLISNSITTIGSQSFYSCSSLASVTVEATTPPSLNNTAFGNTPANMVIYVPAESVEAYKTAQNWSTYAAKIQAIPTT